MRTALILLLTATSANALTIMNVGDSFSTRHQHRQQLDRDLDAAGIPHDFVGDHLAPYGLHYQAYGGMTFDAMLSGQTVNRSSGAVYEPGLAAALTRYDPDVFVVLGGANDLVNDTPDLVSTIAGWTALVDAMLAVPDALVIVSNQIDLAEDSDFYDKRDNVLAFNDFLAAEIRARHSLGQRIHLVDNFSLIDPEEHLAGDGLHPNAHGAQQIGLGWYPVIKAHQAVAVVPEPAGWMLLVWLILGLRRKRRVNP